MIPALSTFFASKYALWAGSAALGVVLLYGYAERYKSIGAERQLQQDINITREVGRDLQRQYSENIELSRDSAYVDERVRGKTFAVGIPSGRTGPYLRTYHGVERYGPRRPGIPYTDRPPVGEPAGDRDIRADALRSSGAPGPRSGLLETPGALRVQPGGSRDMTRDPADGFWSPHL